jgi:hypothetical protein
LTRERGVCRIGKQVVCRVQGDEALRVFRRQEYFGGVLDADSLVARGVHDEKRFSPRRDVVRKRLATHVFDELPADLERALSDAHVCLSVALDL